MPKRHNSGFIHVIPLLILAAVVGVVSYTSFKNSLSENKSKASVLSTTDEERPDEKTFIPEPGTDLNEIEQIRKREDSLDGSTFAKPSPSSRPSETRKPVKQFRPERTTYPKPSDTPEIERLEKEIEREVEISTREGKTKIKLREVGNKFELEVEDTKAQSNFPLSVNSDTGELTVATGKGDKVVSVLPQEAIDSILGTKKFDQSLSTKIVEGQSGDVEYEIEAVKEKKLLGLEFIKVKVSSVVRVSATTGETVSEKQTLSSIILGLLSI